jgi:hypothetical protein
VRYKNTGNYLKGSQELVTIVMKIMEIGTWLFQTLIDTTGSQGNFNFYTNILFDFDNSFNEKTEQFYRHTLKISPSEFEKITADDLEEMYKLDYNRMSQS